MYIGKKERGKDKGINVLYVKFKKKRENMYNRKRNRRKRFEVEKERNI